MELVTLRVEETLIGAVAGTAGILCAANPTRTTMQDVLDRWYGHLAQLLEEAKDGRSGFDLMKDPANWMRPIAILRWPRGRSAQPGRW